MEINTGMSGILLHLWRALCYAVAGLRVALRHEWAFRAEIILSVIAIPTACFLGHNPTQKILLISSILLVLIVELLNTALEVAVNRISIEPHVLSGRAKDLAAAAVLIAILNAIITWVLVLVN